MIAQVEKLIFVTPEAGCEICDETGVMWIDREANATDECQCITKQVNAYEGAFGYVEVIGVKHELFSAVNKLAEACEEFIEREHRKYVDSYKKGFVQF